MAEPDVPGAHDIVLTDEQSVIANPPWEPLFVKACPGAGKTTTIVQRFLNRAHGLPPRRGIAVLSFTNVAAREIEEKSHEIGSSALTCFPNFVGTFDGFVGRFLVTPFGSPWSDKRPDILESWKRLGLAIRPGGISAAKGLTLDELVPSVDRDVALDMNRVHYLVRQQVEANPSAWKAAAHRAWNGLLGKGYLSSADARIVAVQRIRDECSSAALGSAMKARFAEVIVDEAQDCNDQDIEILLWLRANGVNLVVVCDPDQAIYEFRGAGSSRLKDLANLVKTLPMSQNWRSTPNICAVSATLRASAETDEARGEHCAENAPIMLIDYREKVTAQIGDAFVGRANEFEISREETVILAHQRSNAFRAAGRLVVSEENPEAACLRLAQAVLTFRSGSSDARARLSAIEAAERLVLKWFGVNGSWGLPKRICEEQGFDERWLRRAAYSILNGLPEPPDAREHAQAWVDGLKQSVESLGSPPGGVFKLNRRRLPRIPKKSWPVTARTGATVSPMTVHEAKGLQFDAVLFVVPPDGTKRRTGELLSAWENRENFEPKRVAYVAVTRARRLLGIAIPTAFTSRLRKILESGEIPFETCHCDAAP